MLLLPPNRQQTAPFTHTRPACDQRSDFLLPRSDAHSAMRPVLTYVYCAYRRGIDRAGYGPRPQATPVESSAEQDAPPLHGSRLAPTYSPLAAIQGEETTSNQSGLHFLVRLQTAHAQIGNRHFSPEPVPRCRSRERACGCPLSSHSFAKNRTLRMWSPHISGGVLHADVYQWQNVFIECFDICRFAQKAKALPALLLC